MSFRLRVLALVALVAAIAATVTAWLTLQQASRQVTESADAQRQDIDTITSELTEYGRTHGTWERVPSLVQDLSVRTGQRIQLVTEGHVVVVDTDTLAGQTARPVDAPPIPVNPRPTLRLSATANRELPLTEIALREIDAYRSGVRFAACLTRHGVGVVATEGSYGVPRFAAAAPPPPPDQHIVDGCRDLAISDEPAREQDLAEIESCTDGPARTAFPTPADDAAPWEAQDTAEQAAVVDRCLTTVFANRVDEVAPLPLLVYVGAVDEQPALPLSAGPMLGGAGLVAVLVAAGSLLLSRRVLRPIKTLTSASRRLGQGDLSERVPVLGRDELAGLARSFNRMADSLQRAELRQRRLLADVAHELRTPLANLRGYLEALKDGVVAPDPELFASLHEESVLQQRIVDDLQDLALAEAGTLVYHRSRVELGELLETCRAAHQAMAESAGLRLVARSAEPVSVHADPDRLRQVLGNLIGNAVRATPAGGSVTLTGTRVGEWAVVTVTDTGTGIAPEHLPYVFDRFWRADAARGRSTGGSGLGLAISRQIVTDHAGTIEVASQLGRGTTFTIRLPVEAGIGRQRDPTHLPGPLHEQAERSSGRNLENTLSAATAPTGRAGPAAAAPAAAGSPHPDIRPS